MVATRPGLNRGSVLQEAVRLADRVGWSHLTWASLAASLGVRPPSLYNHVEGFDELKSDLAVMGVRGMLEAISTAASGLSGGPALRAIGRAYVGFARANPALYQASLRAPAPAEATLTALAGETLSIIFAAMEPYGLTPSNAVHAVRIYRSALHGLMAIETAGGFRMSESLDDTLEALLTTLALGFQSLKEKE